MWSRINTQSKKKQRQYEVQPKVTLFTFFDIKFEVGTLYNYITSNTDNQFTHFSKGGGDSSVSTEFSETLLQLHNVSCQISLWNGCKSLEKSLTHLQRRKNLWKFTRSFQSLFACTGVMCGCVCVCVAHVCVKLSTVCRSTSGLFQRLQKHLDYCSRLVDVCDWHGKICNKWAEAHHSFAPKNFSVQVQSGGAMSRGGVLMGRRGTRGSGPAFDWHLFSSLALVNWLHVFRREVTHVASAAPPPARGVGAVNEFNDITAQEAQLGWVVGGEVVEGMCVMWTLLRREKERKAGGGRGENRTLTKVSVIRKKKGKI